MPTVNSRWHPNSDAQIWGRVAFGLSNLAKMNTVQVLCSSFGIILATSQHFAREYSAMTAVKLRLQVEMHNIFPRRKCRREVTSYSIRVESTPSHMKTNNEKARDLLQKPFVSAADVDLPRFTVDLPLPGFQSIVMITNVFSAQSGSLPLNGSALDIYYHDLVCAIVNQPNGRSCDLSRKTHTGDFLEESTLFQFLFEQSIVYF